MTYEDIALDPEVTRFADLMPADLYNATVQNSVMSSRGHGVAPEFARDLLVTALQDALRAYAQTPAKTRGGRVARFFASILSRLNIPTSWLSSK